MAQTIIGIMGPGDNPSQQDLDCAYELGSLIAKEKWILLTGGRNAGVMEAAGKGAKESGGTTIGILPDEDRKRMSQFVDIPILTGMGSARNAINVLSSDVVIACGCGAGTMSEIMLAIKAGKNILLLNQTDKTIAFLKELEYPNLLFVKTPGQAVAEIRTLLKNR